MNDAKRGVKILHFLPRWTNGGMEHAVLDIVEHFRNQGPNVEYEICTAFQESDYGLESLKERGVRFSVCGDGGTYRFEACLVGLCRRLKSEVVDVLHCHINNSIGLTFALVAKQLGVRYVIVHTHNNAFGEGHLLVKNVLRKLCILLLAGVPDFYLACSDESGRWTFGQRVVKSNHYHVVHNGINRKKFEYNPEARTALRKQYGLEDRWIVGHIGHFNYQKNQTFLLQTVCDTARQIPNVHYFFVGTGETQKAFLEKATRLGLQDRITVVDSVNNAEDYYSMFDLFAFPSHFEGFGIVMLEAQMSGLPVLCSEYVPLETDISHQVQFMPIDEPDSAQIWSRAIIESKQKTNRKLRTAAPDCAKYDIERISREIEGYYTELMENRENENRHPDLVAK